MSGLTKGASDRMLSMGIWSWLAIVEKDREKLSESAQSALGLLREDLEKLGGRVTMLEAEVAALRGRLEELEDEQCWLWRPPARTEAEVERRIAHWHQGDSDVGDMPLWAYLGWTPFEYADWAETGALPRTECG